MAESPRPIARLSSETYPARLPWRYAPQNKTSRRTAVRARRKRIRCPSGSRKNPRFPWVPCSKGTSSDEECIRSRWWVALLPFQVLMCVSIASNQLLSASARDICPAERRQRIRQSNPKHKVGCYVSAQHRQRHHLHRLQHHHEQRDDDRDLGGFAYQERAHRPLPISG